MGWLYAVGYCFSHGTQRGLQHYELAYRRVEGRPAMGETWAYQSPHRSVRRLGNAACMLLCIASVLLYVVEFLQQLSSCHDREA